MNTPSAARLKISLAENVIVNLAASLKPGESGAVIAEVEGDGVFSLLKKDMPCEVDDRPGTISGIQRNGKKRLLTVRL
jgi:hypothetical protein